MTFNDDAQLDTSRIESGGGGGGFGRGGMVIGGGGGILGILGLILYLLFGGSGATEQGSAPPAETNQSVDGSRFENRPGTTPVTERCRGSAAIGNTDDECLVVGVENSLYDYWTRAFPQATKNKTPWKAPIVAVYQNQKQSACGTASNQVGPFYCPLDKKIYIDASFYQLLTKRFGANGGQLAKMYVVAHEYGHAVEDQLGVLDAAQQDPQGPASGSVRIELMADCFAGMWTKEASTTKDKNGVTLLKPITQQDIQSALSAASAVGDDTIQKKTQGRVTPENFTHGTSEQRQRWFMNGYNNQNINSCNPLRANPL